MRSPSFSKTSLLVAAAVVAMLTLGSGASAQTGAVNSMATATYEAVSGENLPGDTSRTIVYLDVCWEAGGYNPNGVSWDFELQGEAPEWATLSIKGDNPYSVVPGAAPSADRQCDNHEWQVDVTFADDAPNGTTDSITWTIVSTTPEAGTIKPPSAPSGGSSAITMAAIEQTEDPGNDTGGGGGDANGGGEDTEEGPAPLPAFFVTGTLAALAIIRRRQH